MKWFKSNCRHNKCFLKDGTAFDCGAGTHPMETYKIVECENCGDTMEFKVDRADIKELT